MRKPVVFMLFFTAIILLLFLVMQPLTILEYRDKIAVLFPSGIIALKERDLLFIIQAIMLLVVLPVYILTFIFSFKYNASNPKEDYDPDLVDNVILEYIWWGLPLVLTTVVAILTLMKTYELDPFKPLHAEQKPITIQAVALQWNWLFIYPEEKIAALNYLQIPKKVPIHFEITADAPMNSLWIPHLGGQIYAMPSMRTELNLIANETGDFRGCSANISGEGFADMHFITRSSSQEDFKDWVDSVKQSSNVLNLEKYTQLAVPSQGNPPTVYQLQDEKLFDQILMKFMHPQEK